MANTKVQWYYNTGPDPLSDGENAQWTALSEEDNELIEEKYQSQESKVELHNYVIHFELNLQINKHDFNKQRLIKRKIIE